MKILFQKLKSEDTRSLEGAVETKNKSVPIIAVVDSKMMSSMPKGLTAATGMDAFSWNS